MNEIKVNPDLVIAELLEQIKKLILENSILKTYLAQAQKEQDFQ